jgi:hypothetical protein
VKKAALAVGVLVFVFLLPITLMGALLIVASNQLSPSDKALEDIPSELINTYQAAAATCEGLQWTVLAAIHKLETGFVTGAVTSPKGAQGPMQFMPETFAAYGVDGDGDGVAKVNNVTDAVFSAANLLCANGAGHGGSLVAAIWNYNHSYAYVNEVLALASAYGVIEVPAGVAYAAPASLLNNPRIILTTSARADLEAGVVDGRLVALLQLLSARHDMFVTVFKTGHATYVEGTDRVSNHYFGRAADISLVDGVPVSSSSGPARRLIEMLSRLNGVLRPDEIGHPFPGIDFPGAFGDGDHLTHLHIGFD